MCYASLAPRAVFPYQASNLSPVCVSRRLLSTRAYRRLALARQSGDPVKAGLTYVADEEEEDQEDQGGDDTVVATKAAAAVTTGKIAIVDGGEEHADAGRGALVLCSAYDLLFPASWACAGAKLRFFPAEKMHGGAIDCGWWLSFTCLVSRP